MTNSGKLDEVRAMLISGVIIILGISIGFLLYITINALKIC